MESIEAFKKMRDVCNDVIHAYESEDEKEIESAMGRFLLVCMQLQNMK